MTPFQFHVESKLSVDFPSWAPFRELLIENGSPAVRYMIPSPINSDNVLYFVIEPDEIITKFACHGSHEHYDIEGESVEEYDTAYRYAMDEFVKPILDDRLVVVWYDNEGMLVPDAAMFAIKNNISAYAVESWNNPRANHA